MNFSLEYFCEPLMEHPSYFSKRMFGGLAIYFNDLMVFTLVESPGEREWKGQCFDFDLWNGVLVCTSREHHISLQSDFSGLISHPILGKWLYIPMTEIDFENQFHALVERVRVGDRRVGIVPGQGKRTKKKKAGNTTSKKSAAKKTSRKRKKTSKTSIKKTKSKAKPKRVKTHLRK